VVERSGGGEEATERNDAAMISVTVEIHGASRAAAAGQNPIRRIGFD